MQRLRDDGKWGRLLSSSADGREKGGGGGDDDDVASKNGCFGQRRAKNTRRRDDVNDVNDDDVNDDLEERKRSARATVSLSIASVALLWLGSLSACDTLVASAMTTKEETSSLERVAVALERLVKEAREQKGRHERCVRRSWKGCEKTLENEIGKEEERARLARKENEDVVARLANATKKAEREVEMLAANLRSQKLLLRDDNDDIHNTNNNTESVDKTYVDAVNAVLNARTCDVALTEVDNFTTTRNATLGNVIKRKLGINAEETEQLASDLESANERYASSAEGSVKKTLNALGTRREYDRSYMVNKTEDFERASRLLVPEITTMSIGSIDMHVNASFADITNMSESFASKASASMNETSQLLLETASAANDVYRDIATSTMSQMDIIKAAYEEEKKEVQAFFDWYALKVQPFLEEAKLFLNPGIGFDLFETTPPFGFVELDNIKFPTNELQGLNEQTKQLMEKAQSDAQALVSNFRAYSSTMVSEKSKELAEQVNTTFVSTTGNIAERFKDLSMFDDYNPPPLRQSANNSDEVSDYIQLELQLSETRKDAFNRDTVALSKRLEEHKIMGTSLKTNFTSVSERMTNTSRFEELVASTEQDETDVTFNIFAPLGFKAPGAILRNAFQNLKRAKDAVVHADVAYRVIRTVQVVAQHWHFNAFTLEPMDVVSSKQKKKGEGSSYFVEEDGRHRDLNDYSKAHRRGGDDSKKVSTLEKVAKFFGDPVHAAIVKFGMVFFIATIVWSAYYPILQSHSQKCSKKTFLDHIVPEDDVDDAHESEDFQSTSSFLARNAYNTARDYIHVAPNATGEFQRKQLLSKKASAIRTHATEARSEFETLLARADVIESSYRLVTVEDKDAFDTCAPEHAVLRELNKNVTSSSPSENDDYFTYYKNQETLARSALNETFESIETIFGNNNNNNNNNNSSYFISDKNIYMDSTRIHVPCLSNIFAAHCSGVRETPLRFHSKLAACETETFIHQTFSSVFLSLFIFFSVNATRKPFLNALGKIFWRANYVSKRDALRGTFRLDAKTATFSKEYDERYENTNEDLLREQIRAHTTQQERKGFGIALLCVVAQLPWLLLLVLAREMLF